MVTSFVYFYDGFLLQQQQTAFRAINVPYFKDNICNVNKLPTSVRNSYDNINFSKSEYEVMLKQLKRCVIQNQICYSVSSEPFVGDS